MNSVYILDKEAICTECGNKGAVTSYGAIRENGKLSAAIGFGGTIPTTCLTCDNTGLVNFGGLEGYEKAFDSPDDNSNSTPKEVYYVNDKILCNVCGNHKAYCYGADWNADDKKFENIQPEDNDNWKCPRCGNTGKIGCAIEFAFVPQKPV